MFETVTPTSKVTSTFDAPMSLPSKVIILPDKNIIGKEEFGWTLPELVKFWLGNITKQPEPQIESVTFSVTYRGSNNFFFKEFYKKSTTRVTLDKVEKDFQLNITKRTFQFIIKAEHLTDFYLKFPTCTLQKMRKMVNPFLSFEVPVKDISVITLK